MTVLFIIIGFLAVFLFLVFPSLRRHEDRAILDGSIIAHRGLHDKEKGIPENSITAFTLAAARGIPIETDIHLTADGEIVAFHDDTLKRMCGVEKTVEELTLQELRQYRLAGTDQCIPTLKEVLAVVEGRVPLLIEIKSKINNCDRLCTAADKILSEYEGKYFVQSFFPNALAWYRKNRSEVCRGLIASAYKDKGFLVRVFTPFLFNAVARPDFVSYDVGHANRFMFKLEKLLGAFPLGWTFRSQQQIENHKKDFKGFIFEGFEPEKLHVWNKKY